MNRNLITLRKRTTLSRGCQSASPRKSRQTIKSLLENQKIRLDVGCGFNKQQGFTGLDKRNIPGVDIVHDLEVIPWPLPGGSCSIVCMSHVIEHVKPWLTIDVIDECWRVLEDDGVLLLTTPYATSFGYFQDPTHCNPWNEATVTYFIRGQPLFEIYKPKPWKGERVEWSKYGNMDVVLRKLPIGPM